MIKLDEQLKKQLRFIESSCDSYDRGMHDEGIRIATSLRVIGYDAGNGPSILKQMNSKHAKILTTVAYGTEVEEGLVFFMGMGLISFGSSSGYGPNLDRVPIAGYLEVDAWWDQVVMVLDGHSLTRRQLMKAAAHKDGGAHVDKLPANYSALAASGALGSMHEGDAKNGTPIEDAHLVCLRQMGYEVLHSPDIINLAGQA